MSNPHLEKAISRARAVDMPEYGSREDWSIMSEHCHARIGQLLYVAADLVTFDENPIVQVSFYYVSDDNDCGMYSQSLVRELHLEDATEPFFMTREDFGALFASLLADQKD
jgi:hypothetical protein